MQYVLWGNRSGNPLVSRLGFGTTRFPQSLLKNSSGLNQCVELVRHALEQGVNYFDVAPTYANGLAEKILGEALMNAPIPAYLAAKSGLMIDKTADDIQRRIARSLELLKRDSIDFYHLWSVLNWEQYQQIISPGGLYDGVCQAKKAGQVDHICVSLHCDPETTLRIMDEDRFEGITISLNPLNYKKWSKVLQVAGEKHVAVATMNSLGGGIVPKYQRLFTSLDDSSDSAAVKGLRFVLAQPNVTVALSGMPSKEIIDENCRATEPGDRKQGAFHLPVNEPLCSGCNYCAPCSVGIPISSCMQAYNHKLLVDACGKTEPESAIANNIFIRVRANGAVFPDLNQCIGCKRCEKKCTQKINISGRMKQLEALSRKYGYTNEQMHARLSELKAACSSSRKIGIWPAADYASRMLDYWDDTDFEQRCVFFNSSPAMKGKPFRGKVILGPEDVPNAGVDSIVIMHHRLQKEIRKDLEERYQGTVQIICLHKADEVDWFNRMI